MYQSLHECAGTDWQIWLHDLDDFVGWRGNVGWPAGGIWGGQFDVLLWRHLLKNKAVYAAFVPIAVLAVLFALLSPVMVVLAVGLTGIVYVMMRASGCTCRKSWICMALAIVPVLLFLLCGIALHAWMLTAAAVIFALSHPYVTWCNVQTDWYLCFSCKPVCAVIR